MNDIVLIPVLTGSQCEQIREQVHALKEHWIARNSTRTFFTLGAAPYDINYATDSQEVYFQRAGCYRGLLVESFGSLYSTVQDLLTRHLRASIQYSRSLALPGFSIWLADAIPTIQNPAHLHFDTHYLHYCAGLEDSLKQISFTLPIRLPHEDSGLRMWELTLDEFVTALEHGEVAGVGDLARIAQRGELTVVRYKPGTLVIHSGNQLHQVQEIEGAIENDERLTLQGHAVYRKGAWELFW